MPVIMATMPYVRTILIDGEPTLRRRAKKVPEASLADPMFQQLIEDMFATMYAAPGIGLAAPQVGISQRLFVVDLQDDVEGHGPFVMVNPRFTETEGEIESIEGCLSVPGMVGDLQRFERVVCAGFDREGKKFTVEGTGLLGRCLQHEMDHLDGVLYIDKASNVRPAVTDEERAAAEGAGPPQKSEGAGEITEESAVSG